MLSQVLPVQCAQAHLETERSADAHALKKTSGRFIWRRFLSRVTYR
jgi:hypothetical protein